METFSPTPRWWTIASRLSLLLLLAVSAAAQDRDRYQPRVPLPPACRPLLPAVPVPVDQGNDDVLVPEIRGIWVIDHPSAVKDPLAAFDGVKIDPAGDLSLAVENAAFPSVLNAYLGQPITTARLHQMAADVVHFYRRCGHPVVDVSLPPGQDITDGMVQVVIREGAVGQVRATGGCWTDTCRLSRQSWLQHRQKIEPPTLASDLQWLNRNPFRDVHAAFAPGAAEGTTDIIFHVHDRRPVRTFVGYEDSGTRITGLERIRAGVVWTNPADHLVSYQYSTDAALSGRLDVHSLEYRIPLFETRDTLSIYGSWGRTDTAFDVGGVRNTRTGDAWQISVRYLHDLFNGAGHNDEFHFGLDVKGADTFAEFGIPSLSETTGADVHIVQLNAGWLSEQQYCDGITRYGVDLFGSPGGLLNNNHARDFKQVRNHTRATYAYARGFREETYHVSPRSELLFRLSGQLSTSRLLPAEQLGFGGYQSVRGYDYRSINGDNGYVMNLEYRTRPIQGCVHNQPSSLTLLAFADLGQHLNWGSNTTLPYDDGDLLAGAGLGLRYTVGSRVDVRCDYGLPLTDVGGVRRNTSGRLHLGATVSF